MDLEKLFGSKTRFDILKYLIFKRHWVSMRALETDLEWTFPAIKKQIDLLWSANILSINKENTKRSIQVDVWILKYLKSIFIYSLARDIKELFDQNKDIVNQYFFGEIFWIDLDMDFIVVYQDDQKENTNTLKIQISKIFKNYYIDPVRATFMSHKERDQRYRLSDKFVLNVLKNKKLQEDFLDQK